MRTGVILLFVVKETFVLLPVKKSAGFQYHVRDN